MKKRIVGSCAAIAYALVLLVSAYGAAKTGKSTVAGEQEAFVESIFIDNTDTGQERILRAKRDAEEIGRCMEVLEKAVPQEMCAGASYTILVAFDNGKSTYYYVSEEDAEQSSYFESLFENRYLPL